jgi:hypothetical protein
MTDLVIEEKGEDKENVPQVQTQQRIEVLGSTGKQAKKEKEKDKERGRGLGMSKRVGVAEGIRNFFR